MENTAQSFIFYLFYLLHLWRILQRFLQGLFACLTSAVSGKCVAIYPSVEMVLITQRSRCISWVMQLKQKYFVPGETSHDIWNVLRIQDAVLTTKVSTNSLVRCATSMQQKHHQQAAELALMKLLHQQLQTLYFQWWGQQQFFFCAKETN